MSDALNEKVKKLRLPQTTRHIFLCGGGDAAGKCCAGEIGGTAWDELKAEVGELNKGKLEGVVQRTKVSCLRVCQSGPVAVVYPDGIWYRECAGENLKRIVKQHLGEGEPVADLVIAEPE